MVTEDRVAQMNDRNKKGVNKTLPKASVVLIVSVYMPPLAWAEVAGAEMASCLQQAVLSAPEKTTVAELKRSCASQLVISSQASPQNVDRLRMARRFHHERHLGQSPYVITPHKRNYFMPFSYVETPNEAPYENLVGLVAAEDELNHEEAKFQLSLKVPVAEGVLLDDDAIFFGFTVKSFWQMYNSNLSAPFRETNYQPELFWVAPVDWNPFEADASYLRVGIEHESNGRSLPLSRSWNRIYTDFVWEQDNWAFSFKPWYRIPEREKSDANDTSGDDNPDIERYLGHFEFTSVYHGYNHEVSLMLRNNLRADNFGALQLDWTFPLWKRFRGHVQYFNGYGESLVDYDAKIERLGIGILLTDLL